MSHNPVESSGKVFEATQSLAILAQLKREMIELRRMLPGLFDPQDGHTQDSAV